MNSKGKEGDGAVESEESSGDELLSKRKRRKVKSKSSADKKKKAEFWSLDDSDGNEAIDFGGTDQIAPAAVVYGRLTLSS
eukprot:325315-Pleurochrysis_carterae.AAC.1